MRLADVAGPDGATPEDVLDVTAANGERWSAARRALLAWQDWARRMGLVNPQNP